MSDQFNRGGKNDGNRKYQSINLSQHFNKRDLKSAAKSTTGRGLQSLGKVGVSTRRLPRPAVCSSLKKENAGNDPNVALVPGGGGWGSRKETSASQVDAVEGEKGWKDVPEKVPSSKIPAFSQDFPSLGQEAPSTNDKLELRPQTVKWGEKKPLPNESGHENVMQQPPQTFGVVQVPIPYGMVPIPGPIYPGMTGPMYRPMYPPGAVPPQMYTAPPAAMQMPYMYAAPPSFTKQDQVDKSSVSDKTKDKVVHSDASTTQKIVSKGPDHWADDVSQNVAPQVAQVSVDAPPVGYISPYTQPFPAKPKVEEPPAPHIEDKRITYHGRTSSHSSLSEPPEDDFVQEFDEKLDLNRQAPESQQTSSKQQTSRVISRSLAKKELKAFPKDEEVDVVPKTILQKSVEQEQAEVPWDEDVSEQDAKTSVWEERQKQQVKQNVWNLPRSTGDGAPSNRGSGTLSNRGSDHFFDDDYDTEQVVSPRTDEIPAPKIEPKVQEVRVQNTDYKVKRDTRERPERPRERRFMDSGQRKAIEDATNYMNKMQESKKSEAPKRSLQQKPIEILQNPAKHSSETVSSTGNYWQDKQAERDRQEAEAERLRREKMKLEAQKMRQQNYQDYRTPDQYADRDDSTEHRRQYNEEREKERQGIRRRGQDEFYDYDPDVRYDRREPQERFDRGDRPIRYREERSRSDYRESREYKRRDPRGSREERPERSHSDYRRYNRDERYFENRYQRERQPRRNDRDRTKKPVFKPEQELNDEVHHEVEEDIEPKQDKPESQNIDSNDVVIDEKPVSRPRRDKFQRDKLPKERSDRYDRKPRYDYYERSERSEYNTYRRDSRDYRERHRDQREIRDRRDRRSKFEPDSEKKDKVSDDRDDQSTTIKSEKTEKPKMSRNKERIERYKTEQREKKPRQERPPRKSKEQEEEYFSAEEHKAPPRSRPKPKRSSEFVEHKEESSSKPEYEERPPRRMRKQPSVRYYSANPADRAKSQSSRSAPPHMSKDKSSKEKTSKDKTDKSKDMKPKKEANNSNKKVSTESKPKNTEVSIKSKDVEAKRAKKIEKSKIEMDRLKKMTQAGMDLLTIGIYAVDGKELDDGVGGDSEGFVEVVRKKSKKDPEAEKVPEKKTPSSRSKKSKKSDKKKHLLSAEVQEAVTNTPNSTNPMTDATKSPIKSWSNGVDGNSNLMSNIWSNRKNAWEKPLIHTDKQETREILPAIDGESTSLFSSDADLAKKTKEKDRYNWKNETKPPRFTKEKSKQYKSEKKKSKESIEPISQKVIPKEDKSIKPPVIEKSVSKTLDVIPPGVEDLFGLRSDGEEDKPTLTSLVLENTRPLTSLVLEKRAPLTSPTRAAGLPQRPVHTTDTQLPVNTVDLPQHPSAEQQPEPNIPIETDVMKSPEVDKSTETSTQTTPPVKVSEEKQSSPINEDKLSPEKSSGVEQLITSTNGLSLTDQLREIGQTTQPERSQFFNLPGSPLIQSLNIPNGSNIHGETTMTPPTQQPLLGHFVPPVNEISQAHHIAHVNSPQQSSHHMSHINSPQQVPLIGSHPTSSPLSSLSNIVNRPNSTDFLKNYISPMSPTNKMYPVTNQNFVNQNLHQFMSGPFLNNATYSSPGSMSPIPAQLNPFTAFQKSTSPKLHNIYSAPSNNMFENIDPAMISLTQQNMMTKPTAINPNNQQLFYQRNVVGTFRPATQMFDQHSRMVPTDIMYKQTDNILLQSDMSKHVDAKPFNPGTTHPPGAAHPPRPASTPAIFKPDLLQQAMLQQNNPMLAVHPAVKPNLIDYRLNRAPDKKHHENIPRPELSAVNDMMHQTATVQPVNMGALFAQRGIHRAQQEVLLQQANNSVIIRQQQRSMPRLKLARDGRLHRIPDIRNKFNTLIPPSLQQHMQQQSLAQIQQYTAAISRGEDPAKETLPDNMKPVNSPTKKSSANESEQETAAPSKGPPPPVQVKHVHTEISNNKRVKSPEAGLAEEKKIVDEEPVKQEPVEKRRAEKRKHQEVRSTYRRRDYGYGDYPGGDYPPSGGDYHPGDYYDGYREERYDRSYGGYGSRGRGGRYPPPPMFRGGYPPPPPREYRRGPPPPPRHRNRY